MPSSRRDSLSSELSESSSSASEAEQAQPTATSGKRAWTMRSLPAIAAPAQGGDGGVQTTPRASRKTADKSQYTPLDSSTAAPPSASSSSSRMSKKKKNPSSYAAAAAEGTDYEIDYPQAGQPQQGYAAAAYSDEEAGGQPVQEDQGKKSSKKWWLIGGAVVLLLVAAVIVGVVLYKSNSSSSNDTEAADSTAASDLAGSSSAASSGAHSFVTSGLSDAATSSNAQATTSATSASGSVSSADASNGPDSLSATDGASATLTSTFGDSSLDLLTSGTLTATGLSSLETGLSTLGGSIGGLDTLSSMDGGSETASDAMASGTDLQAGETSATATSDGLMSILPISLPTSTFGDSLPTLSGVGDASFTVQTVPNPSETGMSSATGSLDFWTVMTEDAMATDEQGNLVFTFTTSLSAPLETSAALDPSATTTTSSDALAPATATGAADLAPDAAASIATGHGDSDAGEATSTGGEEQPAATSSSSATDAGVSPSSTESAAQPEATSVTESSGSAMGEVFSTTAIFYSDVNWVGACGEQIKDDSLSIALPLALYPEVTSVSSLCGQAVVVRNPSSGSMLNVTVLDASNRTNYAIFTPSTFEKLGGDLDTGELDVQYRFYNGSLELPKQQEEGGEQGGDGGNDGGDEGEGEVEEAADPVELKASSSSSSSSNDHSGGIATFYYQNGKQGACGSYSSDDDKVVALPSATYNNGQYCGKKVKITRVSDGGSIHAKVMDECPSCENDNSLDLSLAAYYGLGGTYDEGQFDITWAFVDAD
ncbi:hypothetical protein JCM8547_002864 [Rhodosporidiobolus lusitaniae]